MENNITLTIDELHAIRKEHSTRTRSLPNDEYCKILEEEATPVRLALEHAKMRYKKANNLS